jgi:hypothetical protein
LAFGLGCCVDFFSSAVVLWRFWAPSVGNSSSNNAERERKLAQREQRADVSISFVLVALGVTVIGAGAEDLAIGPEQIANVRPMIAFSVFGTVAFWALASLKIRYSVALASPSLYKDGICSAIGAAVAAAMLVSSASRSSTGAWWLDPVVSIGAGIGALAYGARCLCAARYRDGIPIGSCRWWFASQGSGGDAAAASAPSLGAGRPGPEHFHRGTSSTSVELNPADSRGPDREEEGGVV